MDLQNTAYQAKTHPIKPTNNHTDPKINEQTSKSTTVNPEIASVLSNKSISTNRKVYQTHFQKSVNKEVEIVNMNTRNFPSPNKKLVKKQSKFNSTQKKSAANRWNSLKIVSRLSFIKQKRIRSNRHSTKHKQNSTKETSKSVDGNPKLPPIKQKLVTIKG